MKQPLNLANPLTMLLMALAMAFTFLACEEKAGDYAITAQVENGNAFNFEGSLKISSQTVGGSCKSDEFEIKGSYDLDEKESKTSGRLNTQTATKRHAILGFKQKEKNV
jgi:hypothetical protein